jgi:hypothetical protein
MVVGLLQGECRRFDPVSAHQCFFRRARVIRALLACTAVLAWGASRPLYAQFTDPRTYTVTPLGLNQLEADYTHAHADASVDTALVVGGARFELNQVTLNYTHYLSALGNLSWVELSAPFARLSGSVSGTSVHGSTSGAADASIQLGMLLMGGRALTAAQFSEYQPATTGGVTLTVTAPTGEYRSDKLLNLGSNRWSFKPEFGLAHPFGPEQSWEIDGYVNVAFFTDNTSYRGIEILRQQALPGFELHLSHDFTPRFWASLDARYAFRGDTFVNGIDQESSQQSLVLGSEASWAPSPNHSFDLVFATAVVHKNAPDATGIALRYVYSWVSARH